MSTAHTNPSSDQPPHNSVVAAIDLLEPGMPLELIDGLHITDNGHLILSRYIDIAPDRASKRGRSTTCTCQGHRAVLCA